MTQVTTETGFAFNGFLCQWCLGTKDMGNVALDMIFEKADMPGPDRCKDFSRKMKRFQRRQSKTVSALVQKNTKYSKLFAHVASALEPA